MSLSFVADKNCAYTRQVRRYLGDVSYFSLGLSVTLVSGLATLVGHPRDWANLASVPLVYRGDGLQYSFNAQRVLDRSFFFDTRTGWPWGSDLSTWPAEHTIFLAIELFGLTGLGWVGAINLIFVSAFALNYLSAYVVARLFRLDAPLAMALGAAFALLPWMFQRLGHVAYTWYWPIPILIYFAFTIAFAEGSSTKRGRSRVVRLVMVGAMFLIIGGTALYYPIFGLVMLMLGTLFAGIRGNIRFALAKVVTPATALIAGIAINNLAFFLARLDPARSESAITRYPREAELYALHIAPLFLPTAGHRLPPLEQVTSSYYATFSVTTEMMPQGALVTSGLVVIGLTIVLALVRRVEDTKLVFLSFVGLFWILFASLSGFNHLFNLFVNPSLRAWARASVLIAFVALLSLFLLLQKFLRKIEERRSSGVGLLWQVRITAPVLAALLITVAVFDQTPQQRSQAYAANKDAFLADQDFVTSLEKQLPPQASVFQLPYLPFPEASPVRGVRSYDHFIGYLHSDELNWSYGVFRGAAGNSELSAVSQQSLPEQIEWAREMGYSAVWINLLGYDDNPDETGKTFPDKVRETFGHEPDLIHSNGKIWLFFLPNGATSGK